MVEQILAIVPLADPARNVLLHTGHLPIRNTTTASIVDPWHSFINSEQARRQHGLPTTIRVDQGSQFTSKELDPWAYANGITLDFSRPAIALAERGERHSC